MTDDPSFSPKNDTKQPAPFRLPPPKVSTPGGLAPVQPPIAPAGGLPAAPAGLGPAGKLAWRRMRACDWLGPADQPLARLVAEGFDRRHELLAQLDAEGPTLVTEKGYVYVNPVAGMVSNLEQQLTKQLEQLGLSPLSRSRIGLAEAETWGVVDELRERYRDRRARFGMGGDQ